MEGHGGVEREVLLCQAARESFGLIALSEPQIDGGAGLVSFGLVDDPGTRIRFETRMGGQRS